MMTASHHLIAKPFRLLWRTCGLGALLLSMVASADAYAQAGEPASPSAASAPQTVPAPKRPVPILTNSSDAQRSLDLNHEEQQPGGKAVPQLRIPFGKKSSTPVLERRGRNAAAASASSGAIDDAAARCESEVDRQLREACRVRAAKP